MRGGLRRDLVHLELSTIDREPKRGASSGVRQVHPFSAFPCARMRQTSIQAIGTGAFTTVTMDANDFDNDTIADLANDQFVIKFPGIYTLLGLVHFAFNATGARFAGFLLNGTTERAQAGPMASGVYAVRVVCHEVVALTRGNTVRLRAFQDTGANLNTVVTVGLESFLAVTWMGPIT